MRKGFEEGYGGHEERAGEDNGSVEGPGAVKQGYAKMEKKDHCLWV